MVNPLEEAQQIASNPEEGLVDLDAYESMNATKKLESPTSVVPDFSNLVVPEVAEEDRVSGFGDYGESSEEEDSDEGGEASGKAVKGDTVSTSASVAQSQSASTIKSTNV